MLIHMQQDGLATAKPVTTSSGPPRDDSGQLSSSQSWSVAPVIALGSAQRLLAPAAGPFPLNRSLARKA
jgi:hypothetical protein